MEMKYFILTVSLTLLADLLYLDVKTYIITFSICGFIG